MKIFVAVPVLGNLMPKCHDSILNNTHVLRDMGHEVVSYTNPGDCYIQKSRNFCVKLFLTTDCTDMIFVDSDVVFENNAMSELIKHDKDIVAGVYRYKSIIEEYPMVLKYDENENFLDESTGLVSALRVPTGFLRINRRVFEKMIPTTPVDEEGTYQFFDTGIRFDDGKWYGEDPYFCRKWIELGGEIWIEPKLTLEHIGEMKFRGNLHEYFLSRQVKNMDNVESGIKGWTTDNELSILSYLASKSKDVVEIGSWKGRSTKVLLESCKGTVYAVDHWNGTETDNSNLAAFGLNVYEEFIKNVGHYSNLKVLRGDSIKMANQFNGQKADMIFIDAGHTYEEIKADIEAWLPKCSKIICGHDYTDGYPGVIKAVNEKFGKPNLIDSLWWIELGG